MPCIEQYDCSNNNASRVQSSKTPRIVLPHVQAKVTWSLPSSAISLTPASHHSLPSQSLLMTLIPLRSPSPCHSRFPYSSAPLLLPSTLLNNHASPFLEPPFEPSHSLRNPSNIPGKQPKPQHLLPQSCTGTKVPISQLTGAGAGCGAGTGLGIGSAKVIAEEEMMEMMPVMRVSFMFVVVGW